MQISTQNFLSKQICRTNQQKIAIQIWSPPNAHALCAHSSETYTHACQHATHILVIKWLETYRFALIYCQFLTLVHSYIYLLLSCMLFPYSNRIPFVRRHTCAYCGSLQLVHLHSMHMNFWFRCSETHMHIVVRSSLGMSGIRNQQHAVQRIVYTLSPHPGMDRMVVRWYSTGYAASMW